MADVLFITPNANGSVITESVGTLLLATILRQKGVQVEIMPMSRFGDTKDFASYLDNTARIICGAAPKILSFYTRCDNYHLILKIAQRIRQLRPEIYIVFGGPQSDITAVETLRLIPYVDFICCGEGENTVYPLFSSLMAGQPDLTVPGLVYRKDGQVMQNPRPEMIADLDTLPDIDYSILHSDTPPDPSDQFPIDVGRGCPFGCTYCSTKSFWGRKYRLKSPQRIVDEIRRVHQLFGTTRFIFDHDMFTMNRKQVIETCRLLKELEFPIVWKCSARIDCIDRELIDIMGDAGLDRIYIGIETGSPRMQKLINKNLKLDTVVPMLSYIKSRNIDVIVSFIYGFPEETEADISQTIAMIGQIARIKNAEIQTHLCTFLPGTELSRQYLSSLTPSTNYSDVTGGVALEECADVIDAYPSLFWHFWEYRTELRTLLDHFPVFSRMWLTAQPVYQYLSEQYPQDRLIDMYYDFLEANRETLEQTKALPMAHRINRLMQDDRFLQRFREDPYFDIITDFYRMLCIKTSPELKQKGTVTEIYCFPPTEIRRCDRLQDYSRKLSFATYVREPNGTVKMQVRSLK